MHDADAVFKALADRSRRMLLDRLNVENGQTLTKLCERLDKPGSAWEQQKDNPAHTVTILGEVLEARPPHRLVITWADPSDRLHKHRHSRVTFEIEAVAARALQFEVASRDRAAAADQGGRSGPPHTRTATWQLTTHRIRSIDRQRSHHPSLRE